MKLFATILSLLLAAPCLAVPAEVNRILRTFDFEERELAIAKTCP